MARARRGGRKWNPGGHKGKLHRALGIPEGQRIPKSRLRKAAHSSNRSVRNMAIRAETMSKWHHGGSRKSGRGRRSRRA